MAEHPSSPVPGEKPRWLDHPRNVTKVVWTLVAVCALLFLSDVLYEKHPTFAVEYLFGFYAIYGFIGSVGLVLAAKWMRTILMRDEDYYDRDS